MKEVRIGGECISRQIEIAARDPEPVVRCAALIGLGELLYSCGASAYDPETDQDALLQCDELPPEEPAARAGWRWRRFST